MGRADTRPQWRSKRQRRSESFARGTILNAVQEGRRHGAEDGQQPSRWAATGRLCGQGLAADLQDAEKGFLWNLDAAYTLHATLALGLLLQQFSLAGDVAAIALGQHVLAQRLDRLARYDAAADGRLIGTSNSCLGINSFKRDTRSLPWR